MVYEGLDPRIVPGATLTIYDPDAEPHPVYRTRPRMAITIVGFVCPSWAPDRPMLIECERDGRQVYLYPSALRIADGPGKGAT